jgi:hypothetical protein
LNGSEAAVATEQNLHEPTGLARTGQRIRHDEGDDARAAENAPASVTL